jgi:predicted small secreted protein
MPGSQIGSIRVKGILASLSLLMLVIVLTSPLVGCNTAAGFGQDLRSLGNAIENKADKNKPN